MKQCNAVAGDNDDNNNNNINNIYDPITRKLTSAARHTLQQELAGLPGVPPVAPRIARKNAELLQPFSDNPVQQALWEDIIVPYARYCTEWDKICAILPAYLLDGTNGTHIYYIDGNDGKEYMFPAVDEFLMGTDIENKIIKIKVIEGMFSED